MENFNNNKKFLFIHYHYPPVRSSGVYRNYYLSEAITKLVGCNFLLTTDNRKHQPTEILPISHDISVHEVFTFDYRRILAWFHNRKRESALHIKENIKKSHLINWIIKLQRSFPFNIFFAEGSILYIFHGYFVAEKLVRTQGIKVVFSSFMPYADHIISWMLKKKFPQLIWVADFRDLHDEPIYQNTLWPDFQKSVEKFILKKADVVTTVSEGISKQMKVQHHNVHTITKGVYLRETKNNFDKFTINYSGSLFQHFRDPRPLFIALGMLIEEQKIDKEKICIVYAGKDGNLMTKWALECKVVDIFENRGMLTRPEALEIQDKSHINLLLTSASNEHTGLLTGKLFEYIEAGREILCLINGAKDREIEMMFDKYGLGAVLYDEKTLRDYILCKYNEYMTTGYVNSSHKRNEIDRDMSWQRQAERVLNLI